MGLLSLREVRSFVIQMGIGLRARGNNKVAILAGAQQE